MSILASVRPISAAIACGGLVISLCVPLTRACTIFVLTDTNRVLFCNNEDWSSPKSRIWFVPVGDGHLGCAYVGFDDGRPQGGLNTERLAFDWVAGYTEKWEPDARMESVQGNPSERMLETCGTVEDAIAFFRKYQEFGFSSAKMLVADKTGASVIIGARDGQLQIERSNECRGYGYGGRILDRMLAKPPEPSVANGVNILKACLFPRDGQYATKYSTIYDLKSGAISLFRLWEQSEEVKLNLAAELKKGAHYYDIPQISQQLTQAPMPLLNSMKRSSFTKLQPIPDQEPDVTKHLRTIFQDARGGTIRPNDYTAELWRELSPKQQEFRTDLKRLGGLVSMTLIARWDENGRRNYRYRSDFANAAVLQHFILDTQNRVALIQSDSIELKPVTADSSGFSAPPPKVYNRQVASITEGNREGLRLDERSGDGLAWWPDPNFTNGIIEFDVRGKDVFQKSFVGVAFHGLDEKTYDAVYFRPFNFRATDPDRRRHAVQYVALPTYDWQKLRSEHPDKYEKPVTSAPAPDQWFHVRIVVTHPKVTVFVNDITEPCLIVEQLSDRKSGWVGFWVGNGSGGDFANLKITASTHSVERTIP